MDVGEYTQARYGRLLELAVELGAPEGQAAAYVDQVLLDQRRLIRRSRDPDPAVREALTRALAGRRDHGRSGAIAIVAVLALVAAVGGAVLAFRPPERVVPSLVGYDGGQAEALLRTTGWDVVLRPVRACDPKDLVTGSDPAAGTLLREGSLVSLRVSVPYDCQAQFLWRAEAWRFVRWARALGPEPTLADPVTVEVDGATATIDDVRRLVAAAAAAPARSRTGMVGLDAQTTTPDPSYCGIAQPAALAGRTALRITLDSERDGANPDCPLTIDLYRTGAVADPVVDAVVVATAVSAP